MQMDTLIIVKNRETAISAAGIAYRIIDTNTQSFRIFISTPKGNEKITIFNPWIQGDEM